MLKASAQGDRAITLALVGAVLFLAFAALAFLAVLAPQGDEPLDVARVVHAVAFASLYLTPAALAGLALSGRPTLLKASGVMGLMLIPTSFSVTPLLVVPSVLVLVVSARLPHPKPRLPVAVPALVSVVVAAACFALLILGPGTHCWAGPGGNGCVQDVFPVARSLAAVVLLGAFLAGAAWAGTPRPQARRESYDPAAV